MGQTITNLLEKNEKSSKKLTLLKDPILFNIFDFCNQQELKLKLLMIGNKNLIKSFDNSINFKNINIYNKFYSNYLVKLRSDIQFNELKERLYSENLKIERVSEILKDLYSNKCFEEIFRIDKLDKIKEYDFGSSINELIKNDLYDEDKRSVNYFILKSIIVRNLLNKLTFIDFKGFLMRNLNLDILDPSKITFIPYLSSPFDERASFKEFIELNRSNNAELMNCKKFKIGSLSCNYNNLTDEISTVLFESLCLISVDVLDLANAKLNEKSLLSVFNILRLNKSLLILNLTSSLDKVESFVQITNSEKDVFSQHEEEKIRKNIKMNRLLFDVMESNLKILNLSNNSLSIYKLKLFKNIIRANKLSYLDISYCQLHLDQFKSLFKWIGHNSYLKALNLTGNKLSSQSFTYLCSYLSTCLNLEFLNLSNTGIGEYNFDEFNMSVKSNSSLKHLFLNNNSFINNGNIKMKDRIFSSKLETLSLKSSKIPSEILSLLINRIKSKSSLKSLFLPDFKIYERDLESILDQCLLVNGFDTIDISNIKHFYVSNQLQESFLMKITYLQVKTLIFKENKLNKQFLQNFSTVILSDSLISLDISSNNIDNSDFEHVLTIVKRVKSLQKLYLNNNLITSKGIDKLISFYTENHEVNLNLISLNSNKLLTDGVCKILCNLHILKGLQFIDINCNQSNLKEILKVLKNYEQVITNKIVICIFENSYDMNFKNMINSLHQEVTFI